MGAQATTKAKKKKKKKRTQNNEFASFQTLSRLFGPALFVKCKSFFPRVEFLRSLSRFKKESSSSYVHVLHKTFIYFHVVVVQWTSKKYTQRVLYVQSCCFAHKINWFWLLSLSWCVSITIFCIVICFETNAGGIDYVLINRLK